MHALTSTRRSAHLLSATSRAWCRPRYAPGENVTDRDVQTVGGEVFRLNAPRPEDRKNRTMFRNGRNEKYVHREYFNERANLRLDVDRDEIAEPFQSSVRWGGGNGLRCWHKKNPSSLENFMYAAAHPYALLHILLHIRIRARGIETYAFPLPPLLWVLYNTGYGDCSRRTAMFKRCGISQFKLIIRVNGNI
jgi:hypothetical protein